MVIKVLHAERENHLCHCLVLSGGKPVYSGTTGQPHMYEVAKLSLNMSFLIKLDPFH